MNCRCCGSEALTEILDLGTAPPSNQFLPMNKEGPVLYIPLKVCICQTCWFIQTKDFVTSSDVFEEDYVYLSSTSSSWLAHCKDYVEKISNRLGLDETSFVVEIASNDGYLLENFQHHNIPNLGIEPTKLAASIAQDKNINTLVEFFGSDTAQQVQSDYGSADLIIGNNVLAHVPELQDFVKGVSILLSETGTANFEFPYAVNLFKGNQYDTIYHEHFSYITLIPLVPLLETCGLELYDVEMLNTHGGSLRVYIGRAGQHEVQPICKQLVAQEADMGLTDIKFYSEWQAAVLAHKLSILSFLVDKAQDNKKVYGYGAAAKGNTLLNYCGISSDMIEGIFDNASSKIGRLAPGSNIPIYDPKTFDFSKADCIIILPWNLADEMLLEIKEFDVEQKLEIYQLIPDIIKLS